MTLNSRSFSLLVFQFYLFFCGKYSLPTLISLVCNSQCSCLQLLEPMHLVADRQPSWYEKWASSWGGKEKKNAMYIRSVLRKLLWATYWNHRCFTEGGGSDKTKCWIAGKTSLSGREEQRTFENHVSTKSL